RRQDLHPATQVQSSGGLQEILHRLQGCVLASDLWEQAVLPLRCRDYQRRHLDELIGAGEWTWLCRRAAETGTDGLAFVRRELLASLAPPSAEGLELDHAASAIVDSLRSRGALFAADLAAE